ncbi:hypothetical protein FRC09_006858, partial [Ceratobasidium sp. 395]
VSLKTKYAPSTTRYRAGTRVCPVLRIRKTFRISFQRRRRNARPRRTPRARARRRSSSF